MTGMMWVELKRELEMNGEGTSQQKKWISKSERMY